jgi:LPS-assembly lipoprotein
MKRLVPLFVLALALPGCGLHPLYAGGSSGVVAQALAQVEVTPIAGKAGWLMGNALRDRVASNGAKPLYRLDVKLDDKIIALGIRADDSVTRERRTLRARFQLIDLADGSVLLDATAGSDAGIDVVSSEYAVIAAENTALENLTPIVADQIVSRVGLYVQRTHTAAP